MKQDDFDNLINTWNARLRCGDEQELRKDEIRCCLRDLIGAIADAKLNDEIAELHSPTLALPTHPELWLRLLGLDPPLRINSSHMDAGAIYPVLSQLVTLGLDSAEEAAALAWAITTAPCRYARGVIAKAAAEQWLATIEMDSALIDINGDPKAAREQWSKRQAQINWE